jgi:glycosyltransferase involved in cell wall biosynthesis
MKCRDDVCIIVPAFNEERVIDNVLRQLTEEKYHVILVDDGSDDETYGHALSFRVTVLRHCHNLGQGAALQTGICYALKKTAAKHIVTFDSDGQHSVEDIQRLLEPLRRGTYDVVLGSRFVHGGSAVNIGILKRLALRIAVVFTRISTGLEVTDTHNGLRAFTADAAGKIKITQNRMAHASEILSQIASRKLRYCEVPVTVEYTAYSNSRGQSLMNSINILWDIVKGKIR